MKATLLSAWVFSALLAAPVFAQEPAAAPPADPGAAPRIVCPEPIFDFGDKNNSESVEHNYVIRNTGNVSLEIQDVRASCGCTAVKPSQNVIPPGGEAFIAARLDLRGRSGMQIKTITVSCNDPATPQLVLQMKGNAIQPLRAEPASLFFGRVDPGAPRSREFAVVSGIGPVQIVGTRTDNPGLVLRALPAGPEADGTRHRFELELDPALPEGNISGSAYVKTDQAGQPEVSIPVAAYVVAPPAAAPAVPAPAQPPIP